MDTLADDGWVVIDGLLPSGLPATLLDSARQAWHDGHFREAAVGHGTGKVHNPAIRGDAILWIEPDTTCPARQWFLAWADTMQRRLNEQLFLGLNNAEFHFARYPAGGGYRRHLDQHRGQPNRRISLVLYLNPEWQPADGGELVVYCPANPEREIHRVVPQAGRLALFRSDIIWHAVQPALQPRWSLTGWFRTDHQMVGL